MIELVGRPPLTEETVLDPVLCVSIIERFEGQTNSKGRPQVRAPPPATRRLASVLRCIPQTTNPQRSTPIK